jgi:hypothetical protein
MGISRIKGEASSLTASTRYDLTCLLAQTLEGHREDVLILATDVTEAGGGKAQKSLDDALDVPLVVRGKCHKLDRRLVEERPGLQG